MHRHFAWALVVFLGAVLSELCWRDFNAATPIGREQINIELGLWSTRLLLTALAVSPASTLLKEPQIRKLRRPLGLAAAFVTLVHAVHYLIYMAIWPRQMHILVVRPYLLLGTVALLLMVPLAATSNGFAVQRLTPKRWRTLHRLVYVVAPLGVAHELMAWSDTMGEVGVHALMLAALLGVRLGVAMAETKRGPANPRPARAALRP